MPQLTDPLLAQASGSVGGIVYSRNQFGPYTRPRTLPLDPSTSAQIAVRNALSECVTAWNDTLTQSEREAWDVFARRVQTRDALGRTTNAGGVAMYVRANVPRIQANETSLPRVDQAPTLFRNGPFTAPIRTVLNIVDDTIHPFIDPFDAWNSEAGAAMLFYVSLPQPLSIHFYRGPYRYAGPKLAAPFGPFRTPATIPIPFPAGTDQRVFVRGRVTRSNGCLSSSFRVPADIVPQVAPLITSARIAGGPIVFRTSCFFDQLLRIQSHNPNRWRISYAGFRHSILAAQNFADGIVVFHTPTFVPRSSNLVSYSSTIPDVFGLLTGLPVLTFLNFPIT